FHGGWVRSEGDSFGDIKFGEKTSLYYQQKFELPFFEYYLKGRGGFNPAEATIFITGSNQWKSFDQWPPKEVEEKSLYFSENERLTDKPTKEENKFIEYTSDPNKPVPFQEGIIVNRSREYMIADQRFASIRPDVIVFQTEPLNEDITMAGPIITNLNVAMTGTDADFVVKVIDVYPDSSKVISAVNEEVVMPNYQMLVRGEILRGKFRNSFSKPETFTPNKITELTVTLPDVAHTFKKGHRIMVHIQHSWFPLADRNPNQFMDIYKAKSSDYIPNTHRIYLDQKNPSKITFSTFK
ncbi:MAG: CocE/NonD family hydrolase, partial [Sphingobacterium sp.]